MNKRIRSKARYRKGRRRLARRILKRADAVFGPRVRLEGALK